MIYNSIFNDKWLKNKYNKEINLDDKESKETQEILKKRDIINRWINRIEDKTIESFNEIQLQTDFLIDIFCKVLGATDYLDGENEWNIIKEQKTNVDSKKADAILGYFNSKHKDTRVIIELKGFNTNLDTKQYRKSFNGSPIEQAFSYVSKYGGKCKWVIVSNYNEIRLYQSLNQEEYEVFYLNKLNNDYEYKRFLYLLSFESLVSRKGQSKVEKLIENNILNQKKIEDEFYSIYKYTREKLFDDVKNNNPLINTKVILSKVQKILDRFIFICFAQDKSLLPVSILNNAITNGERSFSKNGIWNELKGLFKIIDKGDEFFKVNEFNGGLFKEDLILDSLDIPNEFFFNLKKLLLYDYDYDLTVNILGHILEQSIEDIEQIKANIEGTNIEEKDSKRKRDGIYYTPKYITKYMVENTIGEYFRQKRIELGGDKLPQILEKDINYKINKRNKKYTPIMSKNLKKRLNFLNKYREIVSSTKILDVACGSGAFLNEAFDYLYKIRYDIDREIERLTGSITLFDVKFNLNKDILQNNLYGVDLNEESVEITKLSLWLKTANKYNKLTTLDNNIKCGNSLIDNYEIAKEKAFNWNEQFKDILESGGFDIIVGNPPYVDSEHMKKYYPKEREYIRRKFCTARGNWDMYIPFWELSLKLIKKNGCVALITPNKWLSVSYGQSLRKYIKNNIYNISDYSKCKIPVFEDVGVSPIVVFAKKDKIKDITINTFKESIINPKSISISGENINKYDNLGTLLSEHYLLLDKIKNNEPITSYVSIEEAATVSEAYELRQYIKYSNNHGNTFKVINTGTIERYITLWKFRNMKYLKKNIAFPVIEKSVLKDKFNTRYNQALSPKIVVSGLRYFESILDINGEYLAGKSTVILRPKNQNIEDLKFLNVILNSKLITFFLKQSYSSLELDGAMNFSKTNISNISIPKNIKDIDKITLENNGEKLTELYNKVFKLNKKVSNRLVSKFNIDIVSEKLEMPLNHASQEIIKDINKKLSKKNKLTMKQEDEIDEYLISYKNKYIEFINDIIEKEKETDQLVYNLYNLSENEINIIESNTEHKKIFNNEEILLTNDYAL